MGRRAGCCCCSRNAWLWLRMLGAQSRWWVQAPRKLGRKGSKYDYAPCFDLALFYVALAEETTCGTCGCDTCLCVLLGITRGAIYPDKPRSLSQSMHQGGAGPATSVAVPVGMYVH